MMVVTGLCGTVKSVVVGMETGERAATGAPERGDKLCHLVALTLGRLRWRGGAVLAVGADSKRGCGRAQVSIRRLWV